MYYALTAHFRGCSEQCWGYNDIYGELGYSDNRAAIGDDPFEMGDALLIVDLGSSFVIKQVASGVYHRCVLSMIGKVKVRVFI